MSKMAKSVSSEAFFTDVFRCSFPDFTLEKPGDNGRYRATVKVLIPKAHAKGELDEAGNLRPGANGIERIKHDLLAVAKKAFPDADPKVFAANAPVRDGDTPNRAGKKYDYEAGHWVVGISKSFTADQRNRIKTMFVDRNNELIEPSEIYGGCYIRANINVYSYQGAQTGVTLGFNGIRFVRDGEPFSAGRVPATSIFEGVVEDEAIEYEPSDGVTTEKTPNDLFG